MEILERPTGEAGTGKKPTVLIVGGGLAGLTAAKYLSDAGFGVTLLEKRPILGGKVSAWKDADGDWVETGLHAFFGAYEEIYTLMRELDTYKHIDWKKHELTYTLEGGERFSFQTVNLPSPLHLLPAAFKNRYFTLAERLTLVKALGPMLFGSAKYFTSQDKFSYEQWHERWGISKRMLKKMFMPMALALKFLPPDEISAKIVLDVIGIFLRQNKASRMGLLKGSPSELLTGPIADYVCQKGGTVRTEAKVKEVLLGETNPRKLAGVVLEDGELLTADNYLFALPMHNLKKLIPAELYDNEPFFAKLRNIQSVPVISVQLWLDRQVSYVNNLLFSPDGFIPVYTDMGNSNPAYSHAGKSRFHCCVAPAKDLIKKSDEEIIAVVWDNLRSVFPDGSRDAKIEKAVVVRIPWSVYNPAPGIDQFRPSQETPVKNLWLAGGYTHQKFYDSMEGAVQSGKLAARKLIQAAQVTTKL
ncbi:MAG: zeta-carotene desaturase [Chloroflexi bacterium]|nr:zeta-carotene desaturase [Chloroflexota bacterium]